MASPTAGYRLPLESEPHARTFMQWPSRTAIYGGQRELDAVRTAIARIASAIAAFEPVVLLGPDEQLASARAALKTSANLALWPIPVDDLWCRDSGPTFVRGPAGDLAVSELNFNGWGNRQSVPNDRRVARAVATKLGLQIIANPVIGEGGGIEVDGAGTALAHESCWINKNRNRGTKAEIERRLLDAIGATTMIWAPGLKGADITDYHIDALARFVKPGLVVIQLPPERDSGDRWSVAAYETYDRLKQARDAVGRKLEIVVIPEPDPSRIRVRSADFVASYVNYYVCNGAVISAEFGDDTADATARSLLQSLYAGRTIVSLNVDPIGKAGGGIHCATQQQPAATRA